MLKLLLALVALLPAGLVAQTRPGTLLAADPVVTTPPGTQAWRIRYTSTSDRGAPIEVTGMVVAPREALPTTPRRVIAWTHGTWGVATRCAPSLGDFFAATPVVAQAVARGYVVVAPDYAGLGSGGRHPYLAGDATARTVLDGVRAARAISGASSGDRFAVWGESQGGHAALWTAQRARYAPDLTLVGAAAIVPPTDLARNFREGKDPMAKALLTAFTAWSWSGHYGAPISALGKRSTQLIVDRLARNICVVLGGKPRLGAVLGMVTVARDLRTIDLPASPPWGRLMTANSVLSRQSVPIFIAQGDADVLVAPAVTRDYVRRACAAGTRVRYVPVAGGEHTTVTGLQAGATLDWIGARFAGEPPPSDCRKL